MAQHNELGKTGEQLAVDFLLKKQYAILERNFRFGNAEVDIIAQHQNTLAAIEVKTRSSTVFGKPQAFINKKKITLLAEAINHYIIKRDLNVEVRFDIIAIVKQNDSFTIEHLEDAFYHF